MERDKAIDCRSSSTPGQMEKGSQDTFKPFAREVLPEPQASPEPHERQDSNDRFADYWNYDGPAGSDPVKILIPVGQVTPSRSIGDAIPSSGAESYYVLKTLKTNKMPASSLHGSHDCQSYACLLTEQAETSIKALTKLRHLAILHNAHSRMENFRLDSTEVSFTDGANSSRPSKSNSEGPKRQETFRMSGLKFSSTESKGQVQAKGYVAKASDEAPRKANLQAKASSEALLRANTDGSDSAGTEEDLTTPFSIFPGAAVGANGQSFRFGNPDSNGSTRTPLPTSDSMSDKRKSSGKIETSGRWLPLTSLPVPNTDGLSIERPAPVLVTKQIEKEIQQLQKSAETSEGPRMPSMVPLQNWLRHWVGRDYNGKVSALTARPSRKLRFGTGNLPTHRRAMTDPTDAYFDGDSAVSEPEDVPSPQKVNSDALGHVIGDLENVLNEALDLARDVAQKGDGQPGSVGRARNATGELSPPRLSRESTHAYHKALTGIHPSKEGESNPNADNLVRTVPPESAITTLGFEKPKNEQKSHGSVPRKPLPRSSLPDNLNAANKYLNHGDAEPNPDLEKEGSIGKSSFDSSDLSMSDYKPGSPMSWNDLNRRVDTFYTPDVPPRQSSIRNRSTSTVNGDEFAVKLSMIATSAQELLKAIDDAAPTQDAAGAQASASEARSSATDAGAPAKPRAIPRRLGPGALPHEEPSPRERFLSEARPAEPSSSAPEQARPHVFHKISLRGRTHHSIHGNQGFSLARSHRRAPIARDWSASRKRWVASVTCLSTALLGLVIGIYAGEVPAIQYAIADEWHHAVLGNVVFYLGLALPTAFLFPLPVVDGRKR